MSDYSRERYVVIEWEARYQNIQKYEYASTIHDASIPDEAFPDKPFEVLYAHDPKFMAKCVLVSATVPCEQNWYYNRQEDKFYPPLYIKYNQSNEYLVNQTYLFELTTTQPGTFSLTGEKSGNVSTSALIENNKIKIRSNEIGNCSVEIRFVADNGQEAVTSIWMNVVDVLSPIIEEELLPDIL